MTIRLARRAALWQKRMPVRLDFETLESRLALAGVLINEFLAVNETGLQDEDGSHSDWIELRNTSNAAIDLSGWHLTDDSSNLTKWSFPTVILPADGNLVIFASGKNRSIAGQNLHANFELDADGEYLALVHPDGTTIEDSFDPFPAQLADISYGRGGQVPISEILVGVQTPVKALVPNELTSSSWYSGEFDDSGWLSGIGGVGYDTGTGYLSYFNLDLESEMHNVQGSAYLRYTYPVLDPGDVSSLHLLMRYDDGFAVYLNGVAIPSPVGQRNVPSPLTYQSTATQSHNDNLAVVFEDIDLSDYREQLVAGNNLLAIHGLNVLVSSNDFLIEPQLVATRLSKPVTGYMISPTPGAENQEGTLGFVADTKFSSDRGFYTEPFLVDISTTTVGAEIRYTLDGSIPTATNGTLYDPGNQLLISSTTTLRAAAFKTGFTPTNVDTQTYIFLDDVIQQAGGGLPPVANWGYAGPDWEMDPAVVNDPLYSGTIIEDLQSIPTVSLVMPWDDWFGGGGQGIYPTEAEIERAVSLELISAEGMHQFQIDGGIEIQGGTSDSRWKMDKLSMRVKFKEPYGPEKLNATLFTSEERDTGAALNFNTVILDAHLGYTWPYGGSVNSVDQRSRAMYIQDAFVSDLQNLAGGHAPHSRFVHLYLNGLYWGVYDMHERPDEHFAESYLAGDDEEYDIIKHNRTNVVSAELQNPSSAIENYAAMLDLVRQDLTVHANYVAASAKIDIDDFIVYMLVNFYVGNDDWAHQNWYASFNRVDPAGKWRYHSWDAENVLKDVNRDSTYLNNPGGPTEVFQRLIVNEEFRLRFNDLAQKLLYNDGLLTPPIAAEAYQTRMLEVERALVGESARWGDNHTTEFDPPGAGNPYTLPDWLERQNDLQTSYFPFRTGIVLGQFASRSWSTTLTAPTFTNYGGTVASGTQVTVTNPGIGSLYYTIDGSDPRLEGGGIAPSAIAVPAGSTTLTIEAGVEVRARVFDPAQFGTVNDWSAEVDAVFLLETPFPLRITELHYNPGNLVGVADEQDLEFFELQNIGTNSISLDGVRVTEFSNAGYSFPSGIMLSAGERIVVARSPEVFVSAYGAGINTAPTGYFDQNLSNGGERIVLLGPLGEVLQDFSYDDNNDWPTASDGTGKSLEIIDPLGDAGDPANWRASYYVGGSPGSSGLQPAFAGEFINDGLVDGRDFLVWQRWYGTSALHGSAAVGDADGDRDVDGEDLTLWRSNYGVGAISEGITVGELTVPSKSSPIDFVAVETLGKVEDSFLDMASHLSDTDFWFVNTSPTKRTFGSLTRTVDVAHIDEAFATGRAHWRPSAAILPNVAAEEITVALPDRLGGNSAEEVTGISSISHSKSIFDGIWNGLSTTERANIAPGYKPLKRN